MNVQYYRGPNHMYFDMCQKRLKPKQRSQPLVTDCEETDNKKLLTQQQKKTNLESFMKSRKEQANQILKTEEQNKEHKRVYTPETVILTPAPSSRSSTLSTTLSITHSPQTPLPKQLQEFIEETSAKVTEAVIEKLSPQSVPQSPQSVPQSPKEIALQITHKLYKQTESTKRGPPPSGYHMECFYNSLTKHLQTLGTEDFQMRRRGVVEEEESYWSEANYQTRYFRNTNLQYRIQPQYYELNKRIKLFSKIETPYNVRWNINIPQTPQTSPAPLELYVSSDTPSSI